MFARTARKALLAMALAVAFGAGTFAALMAATGGFGGDDSGDGLVALAFRLDEGSPAVSGFAGDLEENLIELPAGQYYVVAVTPDDAVLSLGLVEIADGEMLGLAPYDDGSAGNLTDPQRAAAIRTIATFLADVELAKLSVFESLSGGFQAPLADPSVQPGAEDLEALVARFGEIAGQEAAVTEAIAAMEAEAELAHPVSYVQAGETPVGRLFGTLLDKLLPDFINRVRKVGERERVRSLEIADGIDPAERQGVFDGMPPNLRGGATNFDEWRQSLERGELDDATGAIHGYLYVAATDATQRTGNTPGQSIAEEGGPLLQDGVDYAVESYGKVPHVGKMIDVTNKARKWEEYADKFYKDPGAGVEAAVKDQYIKALKDKIKKDLREMAPNLSEAVLDSLVGQLAARIIANGPQLVAAIATGTPSADLAWIDEFVDTLADTLVANGESGIAVAVITDDLRECLLEAVGAGMTRDEALEYCAERIMPEATPTPEPEPEPTPTPTPEPASDPCADQESGGTGSVADLFDCPTPTPTPAPPPAEDLCAGPSSFDPLCGLSN
jgi:hypothetical protein